MQPSTVLNAAAEHLTDLESDEALAGRATDDRRAFETLYIRHRLEVFRYARARTGDDDLASELTSITFERALASIAQFRPSGAGFRAWLFRIARNQAIDAARRRRTADRHTASFAALDLTEPGPEEDVLRAESLDRLRRLVARLPDTQRDAILLRYAGGLTAREIGLALGRSEAASQKLITRALAALKEAFHATDR